MENRLATTQQLTTKNYKITAREMDILQLMFTGVEHKEIASALHISVDTVKTHLKNLYLKLGVHNKVEALNKTRWLTASPQAVPATDTYC